MGLPWADFGASRSLLEVSPGDYPYAWWRFFDGKCRSKGRSKLPAANSRSGSLDGFGTSGNQFHDGWLVAGAVQDEVKKILEATKSI